MCPSDTFVIVVNTRFAVVDVEVAFVFHCRIDCTIYFFQFDGGEIE